MQFLLNLSISTCQYLVLSLFVMEGVVGQWSELWIHGSEFPGALTYNAHIGGIDSRTCDNFDLMWWKPCACVITENDHRGREYHSMRIEATTAVLLVKLVELVCCLFREQKNDAPRHVTCVLRFIWDAYHIVVLKDSERNEGDGGRQGGEEETADKIEEDKWAFPVKSKKKKGGAGAGASGGAGSGARATKEKQDEREEMIRYY